jgi:hypothetical protein
MRLLGVDKCSTYIRHARIMQHHGQLEFERVREGVLTDTTLVHADAAANRGNVVFFNDDATALGLDVS